MTMVMMMIIIDKKRKKILLIINVIDNNNRQLCISKIIDNIIYVILYACLCPVIVLFLKKKINPYL